MNLSCWTCYSTLPAIWALAQSALDERDEALRQINLYVLLLGAALATTGIVLGLVHVAREMGAKPGSTPVKNGMGRIFVALIIAGAILLLSPLITQ